MNIQTKNLESPRVKTIAALELASKFLSMLLVVLMPIRPVMIAVSVLVIADMITGVLAARKEGKRITSSGFKKTISKTLAYQSAIVVSFVIETYLMEGIPAVKVVAALIALTEGKSFFENLHRITGVDYWAKIMQIAKSNGTIKEYLPKDEEKK